MTDQPTPRLDFAWAMMKMPVLNVLAESQDAVTIKLLAYANLSLYIKTLRVFNKIDFIKEELEKACPGVVSCADIVSIATRDGIMLIGYEFIQKHLSDLKGTGQPNPTITLDFLTEKRMRCQDSNRTTTQPSSSSMASLEISESAVEDVIFAGFVIFNIIWGDVEDVRFDLPAQTITPKIQKDLHLLKLRSAIDLKRHYKKGDSKSKTLPSISWKRKVREIEEKNQLGGNEKWKIKGQQSQKRAKQRRH
ncbi:uncharacterized protein LOC126721426 [Quercus robur]|uniref:uncharacterized protein LOC126721426 n=1 Tax=Quercus robur TaxID=38942 RepID=UPI002163A878|nr:uncharacterized protein LOC126721426 [Quercus robur]